MEILQAIILGIIEGLTEFLPISSTGHLIIAEEYMSFRDSAKTFTIAIQAGAILAVVWYYRQDLAAKTRGLIKWDKNAWHFLATLLVAAIPAALLGLIFDKTLETTTPKVVAIALIVGAAVLWWADRLAPKTSAPGAAIDKLSFKQAAIIGFAQCFALIPGASRSGSTIVGGLVAGLDRVRATTFSFYLGIPILGGAALYKLLSGRSDIDSVSGGYTSILIGGLVSFVVALVAISWLLKYVSNHSFKLFVYWRLALGIIVLVIVV